ncbi:conserved hypothetical protein; possible cell wall protein [Cytophaga hutchinsonii ATCC 33406]|uniref:Internalin-related protein n=2 Tax=Cytophaga hutchinsonii TaxID=985 RepID=A0A6N4SS54_CYTH3|nr:conserved hypothetical protein; possible cell wall protein [Cytophaga hutchinsonii ATCC 33406]SFX36171.1 hypothetical protein SAMN04487930_103182 [Cytophaga hutchinsonii ATCC 33406]
MYMKNLFLIFSLLFTHVFLQAQEVSIPDANFKAALIDLGIDANNDTKIQVSEAEAVHYLNVSHKSIEDLTGIEYFINLDTLYIYENFILSSIDVSKNVKLITLVLAYTQITAIDLSQNTKLKHLVCPYTPIDALDLSNCPALEFLSCHNTHLTSLDLSMNANLEHLECGANQIESLDLSKNIHLKELDCRNTDITSLDLSSNMELQFLLCSDLSISSLDLTKNTALEYVNCMNNENLEQICVTTQQLSLTPNWQKDDDAVWSNNCILTTDVNDQQSTAAAKVVYKVYTITGAEISESNAQEGIYIYLYTDGSRAKLAK